MMSTIALLVSTITVLWRSGHCKPGVIVTAPKIWLLDSEEKVCVTSVGIPVPLAVRAELQMVNSVPAKGTFLARKDVVLNSTAECFVFPLISRPLKTLSGLNMNFKIDITNNETGYSFSGSHKVGIQRPAIITFIQTDKAVYMPSQTVKFRILSFKPNMMPYLEKIAAVYLEDPKGSRIMQWTNIDIKEMQGLADFEMPLSREPVLGQWTITAQIGSTKQERAFDVAEYVLHKHEIVMTPPSYVMITDENLTVEVCAKYTNGKPVKGVASVKAWITSLGNFAWNSQDHAVNLTTKLEGCASFAINSSQLSMMSSDTAPFYSYTVHFQSQVREKGSDVVLTSNIARRIIQWTSFKLHFEPLSPSYFKAGLTYYGQMSVQRPDKTAAAEEIVHLSVVNSESGMHFSEQYITNSAGMVDFRIPIHVNATKVKTLDIKATMPEYAPGSPSNGRRWLYYPPLAHHRIRQWYSPSGSHVQIAPIDGSTTCGAKLKARVSYTTSDNNKRDFHFQVISGGDIVYSDASHHTYWSNADNMTDAMANHTSFTSSTARSILKPGIHMSKWINRHRDIYLNGNTTTSTSVPPPKDRVATFTHVIPVTSAMSGSATLLVFYVLPDGEVVADSITFTVPECAKNVVKLEFLDTQKYPGEKTKLRLQADPGSLCSVGVVDKSTQLRDQDTQLTLRQLSRLLAQYDVDEKDGSRVPDLYCQRKLAKADTPGASQSHKRSGRFSLRNKRRSYLHEEGYSDYADSKQAFNQAGMFALEDVVLDTRPCRTHIRHGLGNRVPLNGPLPIHSIFKHQRTVERRYFFPETWLWELHKVRDDGEVTLSKELPNSITDWVGNAYCTNSITGLGVSPPTYIRAFQPFFISFTLPYSVVRGEQINMPVTVDNYIAECLVVELVLKDSAGIHVYRHDRRTELCVCGQQSETYTFKLFASDHGKANVTVKARSIGKSSICGKDLSISPGIGNDHAVTRHLLVEPEG